MIIPAENSRRTGNIVDEIDKIPDSPRHWRDQNFVDAKCSFPPTNVTKDGKDYADLPRKGVHLVTDNGSCAESAFSLAQHVLARSVPDMICHSEASVRIPLPGTIPHSRPETSGYKKDFDENELLFLEGRTNSGQCYNGYIHA